jgi:senataxin
MRNLAIVDVRRMNVALTRARASLFVLGHCPTLERSDRTWKDIICDARERGFLIEVSTTIGCKSAWECPNSSPQADVGFFTRPIANVPPPPKPTSKPSKKATADSHSVPDTLVPARQIGSQVSASVPQSPLSSPSKSASTPLPPGLVPARKSSFIQPPPTSSGGSVDSPKPTVGQPSNVKSSQTLSATSNNPGPITNGPKPMQNPRPPQPVKRPKQPPSLFIPKKVRPSRTLLTLPCAHLYSLASRQWRQGWRASQQKACITLVVVLSW